MIFFLSSFSSSVDFASAIFADFSLTIYENGKRYDIGVGDGPNKIAVKKGLVFVSNTKDNSISAINLKNKELIKTIKVGKGPIGIEVGERFAYSVNSGSNSVSVIDIGSLVVTSTINVENTPIDAVLREDGTLLYVTNLGDSSISVINTLDNTVVDTIKDTRLIQSPSAIQITPDQDFIYVLNTKKDLLVRIDANKYNIRTNYIELTNVNINNDLIVGNKYALISSNENGRGKIIIIDLIENKIINSIDFDKEIFGIDFSGEKFIVSTDDKEVKSFVLGEKRSEKFDVGNEPRGVKIIGNENNLLERSTSVLNRKVFWTAVIIIAAMLIFWRRKKKDIEEDYIAIPESGYKKTIPERKKEEKGVRTEESREEKKEKKEIKIHLKREGESRDDSKDIKKPEKKKEGYDAKKEFKKDYRKEYRKESKTESQRSKSAEKEVKTSKTSARESTKDEMKTDYKKKHEKEIKNQEKSNEIADKNDKKQAKKEEQEINYKEDYNIDEDFY